MFKKIGSILLILSLMACNSSVQNTKQTKDTARDSVVITTSKSIVDIKKLPEDFFANNNVEKWENFTRFNEAIEDLTALNTDDIEVFLEEILIKTKELQTGAIPKEFDTPQIRGRMKLVRMQTMKSIYFTKHYTEDSLDNSLDKLYQFYNVLLDRMISLTEEENIFSTSTSDKKELSKPQGQTSRDKTDSFRRQR